MPIDKLKELGQAMQDDGTITKRVDNFMKVMLAPGDEGYQARHDLWDALKEDGIIESPTYEEFVKRLGLTEADTTGQQPGLDAQQPGATPQPTQPGQPQQPMQPGEIPEAQQKEQAAPQKPQKPESYYIGGVEVGKVKMPETPNVGLNLGNSQVTIGYRPGQTFTSGGNPNAYREPDDKPIGGLAKVFGEADDDTIIRDYVRNTVGKAIDDAKAAGLKEAESNTIYGSVNGMGALYNAAVVNRRQDPRLIMQSIVDGMSKSIAEDKYLVEMAQKNAAVEGMTVKDYVAQRLYPYLKQQLQQELYQRLLDMHMPTGTLQWFIDGFSEGGLFGNILEGIVNTREQQEITNMARQITSAGQNPYFVPGHWDNFYRGAASLTGMLPEFMVGGMGGGAVATRVFGRGATRLAAMGFTESERAAAMLMNRSAMGLGKRMLLTIGEGSLSGAVTLGSVDAAHSVTQQLRDKNGFSIMEVAKEGTHGSVTGGIFGVTGGIVGSATARAAGAARTAAKIGKFATEAATLTGMSVYDKIKAGMPIDLGDEAIDGVMQTIAMKVASTHTASKVGKFMDNPKQAVKDYLSSFVSPELPEPLSEETRRELEQVGDLVTQYAMIARGRQEYARQQQEAKGRQSTKLGIHEGGTSPEIDNSSFKQQQRQRFEQSATEKQHQILEQMKTLFANPGTTWETRNILSQAMGLGSIPLPPVRRVGDVLETNDGKYVVETMSLDGKILERRTFDNEDDAWDFKNNQQEQATNNRTHRMMAAYPTQSNIAISRMLNEHGYDDAFINAALAKKPEDRTEQEQKMVDMVTDIQKALVTKRQDRTVVEDDYVDEWEDKMLMEMVPDDATISMAGDMNGRAYVTISDENGQVIEQSRTMSHEQAGDLVEAIVNRQGQNIYDKAQSRANIKFAEDFYESFLQQDNDNGVVNRVRRYDELKEKQKDGLTDEEQAEFDDLRNTNRHDIDAALVINNATRIREIQEKLDNDAKLDKEEEEIVVAQMRLLNDYARREDVTDAMEKEYESLNNLPEGTLASIMTKPVTECDDAEKVIREGYLKSIGAWVKRSKEASAYDAFKLGFEATPQQRTTLLQQADEIERRIRQEKGYDENVSIADVVGFDGKNAESTKRRIMFGTDSDNVKDLFAQWIDMQVTKDGMQRSIDFEVKARIEAARKAAAEVTGKDGMVRGLRLVEKDGDGNPLQVYVKDGNIVLRNDGSIDKEASDNVIYVQAPGEDKPRPINVDLIESMDAPKDGRMYAAMMARQAEQEARQNAYAPVEPVAENGEGGRPGQNGQGAPAEGGTPPAEAAAPKKVKLAISGQDYDVEVLGEENGMVKLRDLESGEVYDLSRERFDAFAKAADDKAAAAQAEAAAQAQREENRKAGITGYAEGNPDLSHPDNDMRLVIDYLKEQEPAQQDRVKTQAATHIGTLNDNIESLEADVARRREWYENAKDMSTPENLSARKEALDKAEAELAEAKARRDNWERVRVALMSDKELNAMKEERKASRQQWETEEQEAQKDSKPVLSGEKTPLDKDAVLEKYETRGEANQAMLSEFRRHDRRVGDIDNRIRYIDKQLDAWRDGEPMTEQDVRALIAEREALRKEEALLGDRMAALRNAAKKQLGGWYKEREQANMSESERKYAELDKETDYNRKMKLAKEAVMADKDIDGNDRGSLLMILDRVEPETVEEFVAENLPYGAINWEGLIGDGGRKIRGLKDELGGRRGIGHNYDTNAYNAYLAKKGEGKSPDQIAHEMWEASPEDGDGNKRWSDVEIKQAMLDLLHGAGKPTDISHRLPNDRIEEVLQMRDEMIERHAEEAEMEAQQPETAEAEPQPAGEFRDPITGEVIDPNEKVPFQKVEGESDALTEEEVALRDALVEKIAPSVDVVMDERGQRVLDADRERRARMMGASPKTIAAYRNGLDVDYTDKNGETKTMRLHAPLQEIESMQAEKIVKHSLSRDDQKKIYFSFKPEVNDFTGEEVEFYHSTFGKNHRDGGLFEKIVPQIRDLFKTSILAFSEPENLSGQIRPDGTIHKEHRGFIGYGNYLNKVLIDGKEYYVRFTIQRKKNESGLHSSFVSNVELYENPIAVAYVPSQGRGRLDYDRITDAKLKIYFDKCKDNSEKLLSIANKNEGTTLNLHKVSEKSEKETQVIFDTAKKKFGVTSDLREAGYILPDGTMLDFSGRHELFGADDSGISGRRSTDHRGISQIAYAYDAEGNEIDTGVETTMPDFIERGAIRIDANAGTINLSVKPTAAQRKALQRLIQRNGGDVSVDYGNGWDSDHYSEYDSASARRVLSDIDRYFDEGIRTDGNIKYFRTSNGEAYGFTLGGKIYIDPRIARADTPIHEYTHLWAEGMRESDPEGWKRVVDLMRGEKELWEKVKKDYPELKTDDELADEVLAHYSGTRGAERLREEMRKIAEGDGTLDAKTRAIAALENVRRALNDFWRSVANKLGIKFTTAEEVADMVLRDMLNGVDPREKGSEGGAHRQEVLKGDIFVSNARKAVEGIKQDKATGDQWLAMIQKQGGLKAAEDKWLGLSDWLNERKGKPVTKDEVMNFIRENQVQIEEVNYTEEANVDNNPTMQALREEFLQLVEEGEEATNSIYISDHADWALEQMRDRYGDDFLEGFEWSKDRNGYPMLVPIEDWNGGISGAARYYLGIEDRPIHSTRLQYTTEGLENKKEIALTVPNVESWNESDEIHFGDAGEGRAVAWIRFGDTTDADGNRVLVIDEIQSKRHQEGREKGYKTAEDIAEYERLFEEVNKTQDAYDAYTRKIGDKYDMPYEDAYGEMTDGERAKADGLEQAVYDASNKLNDYPLGNVPDAPFEKNWHELAMKRMLRYAAENGYDKIAWTKGDQQAERYNLAAVVNNIAYVELPNGEIDARAYFKDGGYEFLGSTWKEVEESVGKDMARRMQQGESTRTDTKEWGRDKDDEPIFYDYKVIEGDGLRIGGEGMKGFYDEILPRFMKKYGKKWGATVGEVELPYVVEESGRRMHAVDVTPEMRVSVLQGQPMFQKVVEPTPFTLSEKKDREGNKMYERNGSINLWEAAQLFTKARRQNAPIRLSERNMKHIISNHSDRLNSEDAVFNFLDNVFANATKLRRARGRGMFVVVENENTDSVAIIKLMPSDNGDYYNIDSAGYYRKDKWKKSEDVIADLSEPSQSDAAADASKPQDPDKNGEGLINAKAQPHSSGDKDSKSSSNMQENSEENSSDVDFVGESVGYREKPIQVNDFIARRIQKFSDNFTDEQKEKILAGYNKVKNERPNAIALIKTPEGYVLINKDMRQFCEAMNMPTTPFLRIKENDIDLVLPSLVRQGKPIGIVDIADISTEEAAGVVPLRPETKAPTPPVEKAEIQPIEKPVPETVEKTGAKVVSPAINLDEVNEIKTEAENDGFAKGIGITLKMKDGNEYHLWVDTEDEKEDYFGTVEFYGNNNEEIPSEEMTKRFGKFFDEHISNIFGSEIGKAILSHGRGGLTLSSENLKMIAGMKAVPQNELPKTNAAPEGKPLSNTGTAQTEKDPGVYGWADPKRSVYWNEEPEFKSISDAAWWCYDLIGNVRSAGESKEYTGKDYSRLLSMDDSHGEQVDVEKAKKHAGMVIPMAEMMKKHLIVARDRSKSEAAARYVQGLIDECDNAIDWYQRAAKGDRTIFDDERPRMFRVSRDGKGLDKKTVDGTWTESEVRVMEQKLGGTKVTIDTEETIPETVRRRLLLGEDVKGWYDESDGSVHLYAPAIESVEDARYTICHEKLGHEGLTALLGSQQAVTDWGNFMYLSASRDLRAQMDEIARTEFAGDDNAKSKAAQEVFAQIAEDGPRSKEEFSLWRRVKHFFIKQAQKRGWNVRGLLNDADMRYYVLKTGEALKRYEGMDDAQKMETSRPGLLFSTGGSRKPRKRQNESMASFLQRLERWEVERQREEDMRLAGAEAPEKEPYEQQWQAKYEEDDAAWRERHGLTGDEPEGYPRRQEGESDESLMQRVREYEQWENAMRDQDDKRPIVWEYEQKAYHEWRDAVKEFERQWGIEDEDHAALDLFDPPSDGPVDVEQISPSGRPMTPEEAAAEHATLQELGDALGADMSARGAKRHTKLAVIQRRKDLEGRSAEDTIYVHELSDKINAVARRLIDETGARDQSKKDVAEKIRNAIPFIIEIPRRQREIADDINSSLVWQYGRLVTINGDDIAAASRGIDDLRDAINRYGIDSEEAKDAARRIADIINAHHEGDFVGVIHEEVVNNGAVEYLTDLMNNTEPAHRGGKPIPETTPDEIRQNADDLERLRLHLSQLAQAINAGNVGEVRDSIVGDINAVADRYVEAFNARHAEEISNGSRRAMTTGDLIDIMWLSRTKLKENAARIGVQGLTGSDVLAIGSMFTRRVLPEEVDFPIDRVQDIVDEIGDWYSNWFMDIENAGLRPQNIGRVTNYVNHRWEHESGLGAKIGDENYQRTRSANMRERTIPTLMTGLEVGLTPKSTDIVDLMSYYSRHNAEAVANKGLIDALENVKIYETDADGEPIASVSLLTREEPELAREKYELYDVPGAGIVWVHKEASKWFANVFGALHKSGESEGLNKLLHVLEVVSGTMKKINLSFSGFHLLALSEVYLAQAPFSQYPIKGWKNFAKYLVVDCIKKGTSPAYANPEVFKDAARHLVKLGASDDYAASEVLVLTEKFKDILLDARKKMAEAGLGKTASKVVTGPDVIIASLLDWSNKGMDKILWTWMHDGLKLAAYDLYAKNIRKRAGKEGWDETTIDKMLDEAGQYVNDMFGGQYWELINVNPSLVKILRAFYLSPDWLISTNRHIMATIGFGSLHSEKNFKEYATQDYAGLKRLFPKEYRSEKDIFRAFRSKNSRLCYTIGVAIVIDAIMNAFNIWQRKQDEEEQAKIAEEKRASGDSKYMSPYELAYPDGMDWLDYTMFGNTIGKKTLLFVGRDKDGKEVYVRWGKQFRELPELFLNEKMRPDFPFPLINRMKAKANSLVRTIFESFIYADPNLRNHWDKELADEFGEHIGFGVKVGKNFLPFSLLKEDERTSLLNYFLPKSKGMGFYKAKEYLREFIDKEDKAGVRLIYQACVMNGLDFKNIWDAVEKDIKAEQRAAAREGAGSMDEAVEKFDKTNSLSERKTLENTIRRYQNEEHADVMRLEDAVESATAYFTSQRNNAPNNWQDYYLLGKTGEDVKEDMDFSWLKSQCNQYAKFVKELKEQDPRDGHYMELKLLSILKAGKDLNKEYTAILDLKKDYADYAAQGKADKAAETMDKIRKKRKEVLDRHKKLMGGIIPFDERIDLKTDNLEWLNDLKE